MNNHDLPSLPISRQPPFWPGPETEEAHLHDPDRSWVETGRPEEPLPRDYRMPTTDREVHPS